MQAVMAYAAAALSIETRAGSEGSRLCVRENMMPFSAILTDDREPAWIKSLTFGGIPTT